MQALRTIYKWWAAVVFVGVLAQVGAAGYGAFHVANKLDDKGSRLGHDGFEDGWDFHAALGYIVIYAILILLLLGLIARLGRPRIWWPLGLAVAGVLQAVFAWIGIDTPWLGFLHPVNALVIFALSGLIAHRAWRGAQA